MIDFIELIAQLRTYDMGICDNAADAITFLLGEIDAHSELCPLMKEARDGA